MFAVSGEFITIFNSDFCLMMVLLIRTLLFVFCMTSILYRRITVMSLQVCSLTNFQILNIGNTE